jgi:zinc/manganese transport system substrate-binding protein
MPGTRFAAVGVTILVALAMTACAAPLPTATTGIRVVAAEDFWGSIAQQLGGDRVHVTSIITNPATDPHDYEPTVADGRMMTTAQLVIENGVGYDPWAARLISANPDPAQVVLDVGRLVGVPAGGNPHRWYYPSDVHAVIAQITADYKKLDPAHAAYYDQQRTRFETVSLAQYDSLIAGIKAKYAGTPIGASESIVVGLAEGAGLHLITPNSFLNAISQGNGPTAADKSTVDAQIRDRLLKVFIYNAQNATPDVAALVSEAKAAGIRVVTVTETMVPANGTFQGWQTAQLERLEAALHEATGR